MAGLYQILRLRAPTVALEAAVAELFEAGCLGAKCTERDQVSFHSVYFPSPPETEVTERRSQWEGTAARCGCKVLGWETLEEQDWLEPYRALARPFDLGRGFVVDPREPDCGSCQPGPFLAAEVVKRPRRALLRLPARRAFGVGSHETTQLAVELLETASVAGRSVLDIGCGTGILGLVALNYGAASVTSLDIDPAAAFVARCNQLLNHGASRGLGLRLFAGEVEAIAVAGKFDLIMVNVLPEKIAPQLAAIRDCMAPDGDLVVSGVLTERLEAVESQWRRHTLRVVRRQRKAEWTALHLRAAGPDR